MTTTNNLTPKGAANQLDFYNQDPIDHPRLKRLTESLTYRGSRPVRWDISHDLGIHRDDESIIADPKLHSGQAHIAGTDVTLLQVVREKEDTRNAKELARKPGLTDKQVVLAVDLDTLLHIPGWPPNQYYPWDQEETGP